MLLFLKQLWLDASIFQLIFDGYGDVDVNDHDGTEDEYKETFN